MSNSIIATIFLFFGMFLFAISQTINQVPCNLINFLLFIFIMLSFVIAGFIYGEELQGRING